MSRRLTDPATMTVVGLNSLGRLLCYIPQDGEEKNLWIDLF